MFSVALSPKARALIQAHREAPRPTAADRDRVAAALRARLGPTVMPLDPPIGQSMTSRGTWRRFAAACGLCIAGSALLLTHRREAPPQSAVQVVETGLAETPAASSVPMSATATPSGVSALLEPPAELHEKIAPSASRHTRLKADLAASTEDTLAQELVLLTSATSQLSSGQAAAALKALDEHQRRFPQGVLSDERNAAKGRALCKLHRFDEGRAVLALLGVGTPFAARVKEECDSASSQANAITASRKATSD